MQYFDDYNEPVFFHQLLFKEASALGNVDYPDPAKRPYDWTYCPRLHGEALRAGLGGPSAIGDPSLRVVSGGF